MTIVVAQKQILHGGLSTAPPAGSCIHVIAIKKKKGESCLEGFPLHLRPGPESTLSRKSSKDSCMEGFLVHLLPSPESMEPHLSLLRPCLSFHATF